MDQCSSKLCCSRADYTLLERGRRKGKTRVNKAAWCGGENEFWSLAYLSSSPCFQCDIGLAASLLLEGIGS